MSEFYQKLFGEKYLDRNLKLDLNKIENLDFIKQSLADWYKRIDTREIFTKSEKELQPSFYSTIFTNVLGYKDPDNMIPEKSTEQDGTKPDASLGFYMNGSITRVVVEMKDANTDLDKKQNRKGDNRTPVEQAFGYVGKQNGNCKWVIVSNFVELRLYSATDQSKYQLFNLKEIATDDNKLCAFLELLNKDHLVSEKGISRTEELFKKREEEDKEITNKFYKEYKQIRIELYNHIKDNNPSIDEITVLNKTQKILDRIIFVCFCEDLRLMPHKTLKKVLESVKQNIYDRSDTKIWNSIKALFDSIDKGNPAVPINRFNGGLFKEDEVLNNLIIKDNVLEHIIKIEEQDFESELNVNILGHIFEQSISDLEELKASIEGAEFDSKKGKRKKDGVFYTPEYITRYIVDQTIGGWLNDRKQELGYDKLPKFTAEDYAKVYEYGFKKGARLGADLKKRRDTHIKFWQAYMEKLNNIKVCDPACGSGSFLVQVFDYLKKEGQVVKKEIENLQGIMIDLFSTDEQILENNIFGVDINRESVEITKLALWLKTADKSKPLTSLDENIKCGNSLIDDPKVAGDLAFDWQTEYKEIMVKGGFDVIVGNPPYVFARGNISQIEKNYYSETYQSAQYQVNTYLIFIEKTINLINQNSYFGFIVPNAWLMVSSAERLREFILENCNVKDIVNLSGYSFEGVNVETIILNAKKQNEHKNNSIKILDSVNNEFVKTHEIKQSVFATNSGKEFQIFIKEQDAKLLEKIKKGTKELDIIANVKSGLKAYESGKGNPKQTKEDVKNRIYDFNHKKDKSTYPYLEGRDVGRYEINWGGAYLQYGDILAAPRTFDLFNGEKIIIREITGKYPKSIIATYSNKVQLFNMSNIAVVKRNEDYDLKYIVAILNSSLMSYYFKLSTPKSVRQMFPKIILKDLRLFPIKEISRSKQKLLVEKTNEMLSKNKELSELSNKFLSLLKSDFGLEKISKNLSVWYKMTWDDLYKELKKQKATISTVHKEEWFDRLSRMGNEAKQIKSIIDTTDREIDKMVYKLYNLTTDEIKIIEGE